MLICVRYNLILLKFDIVKLLLCNTNTTTNANEIKALTRVESEFFLPNTPHNCSRKYFCHLIRLTIKEPTYSYFHFSQRFIPSGYSVCLGGKILYFLSLHFLFWRLHYNRFLVWSIFIFIFHLSRIWACIFLVQNAVYLFYF